MQVGYGDVVTVRVPTREGGNCLYWEFATDSYDIGFGVYFEWGKSTTNEVSVQVCDSEDEDELDGADEEDDGKCFDIKIILANSFPSRVSYQ